MLKNPSSTLVYSVKVDNFFIHQKRKHQKYSEIFLVKKIFFILSLISHL